MSLVRKKPKQFSWQFTIDVPSNNWSVWFRWWLGFKQIPRANRRQNKMKRNIFSIFIYLYVYQSTGVAINNKLSCTCIIFPISQRYQIYENNTYYVTICYNNFAVKKLTCAEYLLLVKINIILRGYYQHWFFATLWNDLEITSDIYMVYSSSLNV